MNIPAKHPTIFNLGQLCYKICLAYITSFIFYFVNIHMSNYDTKSKNLQHISQTASLITLQKMHFVMAIQYYADISNKEYLFSKDRHFESWCSRITTNSKVMAGSSGVTYQNWGEYPEALRKETKELLDDLSSNKELLSDDTKEVLLKFFNFLRINFNFKMNVMQKSVTLKENANILEQYIKLCESLQELINTEVKKYTNR
ncbi:hypothetical protein [Bacillus mycoides]|uniref:hypothetical protein n=1 Tax=Bacillus mycoides TaxID=1405 RepID=UPI003D090265